MLGLPGKIWGMPTLASSTEQAHCAQMQGFFQLLFFNLWAIRLQVYPFSIGTGEK